MQQKTFLMKKGYLNNIIYDGVSNGPRTVFGSQGNYQRHHVADPINGAYDVITKTLTTAIPVGSTIQLIKPIFYPDFINGNQIAPALDVYADDIEIVGGNN